MSLDKATKPIVHIATDEKFIDAAYEIYETAFPSQNKFLILLASRKVKIKHISENKNYEYFFLEDDYIDKIAKSLGQAKYVVFHGMSSHQAEIVLDIEFSCKLIWTVFGGEVYSNPKIIGKKNYGKKTFRNFLNYGFYLKKYFRTGYYRLCKWSGNPYKIRLAALKKMDYASVLYKEEMELFKQLGVIKKDLKWIKFTYYPLEIIIEKNNDAIRQSNILLGNSASYSNNHLEVFDILKNLEIGERKIITPLSYGDKEYADEISSIGHKIFPKNFSPLRQFLPLKEYQKITHRCGIVIMNHYRQQAVGNVLDMLYCGAKVYLSKQNTLYHYLERIGCYVYCIEDDMKPNNTQIFKLLSEEQVKLNRKLLSEEISLNHICKELKQTINP